MERCMTDEHIDIQTSDAGDGYDRHDINVRWVAAVAIIVIIAIAGSVLALF